MRMPLPMDQQTDTSEVSYQLPLGQIDDLCSCPPVHACGEQAARRPWPYRRSGEGVVRLPPNATTNAGYIVWPIWLTITLKRLKEISDYSDNWDSYGSPRLSRKAISQAKGFLLSLPAEIREPMTVPVPCGGIQFEWQGDGRELEIEIRPDGRIEYLAVFEDGAMKEGEILSVEDPIAQDLVRWVLPDRDRLRNLAISTHI